MSSKALAQTQDKALQLNLATTIYGTFVYKAQDIFCNLSSFITRKRLTQYFTRVF